ncbi:hypothetical protein ACA910_000360 [Epithemia clementina (nom. ined.)]
MPRLSDRNYAAVTRFRRPYSTRPPVWLDDPTWRSQRLEDDEVDVQRFESAVAPLLEEGELDADAIVVTPAGNSSVAANHAAERRRREERWNDIGLDQLLMPHEINNSHSTSSSSNNNAPVGTNEGPNRSRTDTPGGST